jgi:carbon-monoxide dehydrogenase small subunit
MTKISLTINGEQLEADVEPRTSLADFLRASRGLTGTHIGCEHGVCGACTVTIDGSTARSCITYAVQMQGRRIDTIEGYDDDETMSALRSEFSKQHALQCGFCTPGMLITARDIVRRLGNPGEARVREELAGNLCRCTGYAGIVQAVQNVGSALGEKAEPRLQRSTAVDATLLVIEERDVTSTKEKQPTSEATSATATVIEQTIVVDASGDRVWEFFHDVPQVAACLPGAELLGHGADSWEGTIRIKMGPIRAQLKGKGRYELNEERKTGKLDGAGADALSSSRVKGSLDFTLSPHSPNSTSLTLSLSYVLQGALAQFSRSSLAKEFVRLIVLEFGRNVSARLSGKTAAPDRPTDFNVLRMLRLAISSWWRGRR